MRRWPTGPRNPLSARKKPLPIRVRQAPTKLTSMDRTSNSNGAGSSVTLTALAILPNRDLAQPFVHAISQSRAFQISTEWVNYPPVSKLELQMRQAKPQVLLIDVSANLA